MKKKVLIIDDEQDFGLLLQSFFSKQQYDVKISHTIADGMKALEETKPDLLFLDNNLPDGLGWGKAEYILRKYPKTRLNLVSAYHVPNTIANKFHIMEKPISMDELKEML